MRPRILALLLRKALRASGQAAWYPHRKAKVGQRSVQYLLRGSDSMAALGGLCITSKKILATTQDLIDTQRVKTLLPLVVDKQVGGEKANYPPSTPCHQLIAAADGYGRL